MRLHQSILIVFDYFPMTGININSRRFFREYPFKHLLKLPSRVKMISERRAAEKTTKTSV